MNDGPVYRNYSQAELDAQYAQSTLVPDLGPYARYWAEESRRVRETLPCRLDVAYGERPEETLDIVLPPAKAAPIHVYVHGGAWRRLSKNDGTFPARHLVPAGAAYVALNFGLAPDTPLDEMVRQVRAGIAWVYRNAASFGGDRERLHLSGHSSGGHLVGMALAAGWRADFGLPEDAIRSAIAVSGIYDLEPVRRSARNDYLRLDEAAARRNSPIRHIPKTDIPLYVAWGAGELDEFRRQSRAFAAAWLAAGHRADSAEWRGYNHFDMSNAFADPDAPIVETALRQMGLA